MGSANMVDGGEKFLPLVVDALKVPGGSYAEVARRLGCTREYVRQVDWMVNRRTAMQFRPAKQPKVKVFNHPPAVLEVIEKLRGLGCSVLASGRNRLRVDGKSVSVHEANAATRTHRTLTCVYSHFGVRYRADLNVLVSDRFGTLVVPGDKIPAHGNIFVGDGRGINGYHGVHNWLQYRDAWHYFGKG